MSKTSNVIDYDNPGCNMFGLLPCPKCKSVTRYILARKPTHIQCDDCGGEELLAADTTSQGEKSDG